MAVTKIWKISGSIDSSISYIEDEKKTREKDTNEEPSLSNLVYYALNPDKTEEQVYVTGINCDKDNAVQEMIDIKNHFQKTDGIKAFHAIQSFKEGEITPQKAHEIGVKLAEEMWGDRFQVVVSTHLNTENLHNHFIINSVSFVDGKKLYDGLEHLANLRNKSDELCLEYQISVLKEKPSEKGIDFEKFLKKYSQKNQYYSEVKSDIDKCIKYANSYEDFFKIMKDAGYYVVNRSGKLSVKRIDRKRNIRIERVFGKQYSIDMIKERIQVENEPYMPFQRRYIGLYIPRYKRNLSKIQKVFIVKSMEYSLKVRYRRVPKMSDIKILDRISDNTRFLCTHRIKSVEDLLLYRDKCLKRYGELNTDTRNIRYMLNKKDISKDNREFLLNKLKELKIEKSYQYDEVKKCEQVYEMTSTFREEQKKKEIEKEGKEISINEYGNRYRS